MRPDSRRPLRLAHRCRRARSDSESRHVLIEAMGWIREFRDSVTVVKLGGSVLEDEDALRHLLVDIVFMETVGMRPIIVHGGGVGDQPGRRWPRGSRPSGSRADATPTTPRSKIVERVLAGEINEAIAARIEELGGRAMPLNFTGETDNNVLFGEPLNAEGR